jgi:glutamate synthase (NADPH/NADH) small chain
MPKKTKADKNITKADKKKLRLQRESMPRQDPAVRAHNFAEVALGYSREQALREASRCLACKKPLCVSGCPVEVDIPGFIDLVRKGDFLEAARVIKRTNSLPAICGRVCPQEDQCEKACVLAKRGAPIAIGRLERFVADEEAREGSPETPPKPPSSGKKVAVVGAGPAGLTVAGDLIKLGHSVTVFEALHEPGGVLMYGIPEFRLPKEIVRREVAYIESLGVDLKTSFVVGMLQTVDELMAKGYDAVFLGNGAGLPYFMGVPGENLNGVYSANEFLTRSNLMKAYRFPEYDTPIKIGRRVVVVGGGNVAMDSLRTALRLGAEQVTCVYRRSRNEMPAREEEIENAEEEGIEFRLLTNPVRILGDDQGWVRGMECIRMELGEPDDSGRRRPVPVEGSEFTIDLDQVIVAIGQGANPLVASTTAGLETNKWGYIVAHPETGATSKPGVYAGGDIVTGAATVILAMGAGRKAARAIDEYLRGLDR